MRLDRDDPISVRAGAERAAERSRGGSEQSRANRPGLAGRLSFGERESIVEGFR